MVTHLGEGMFLSIDHSPNEGAGVQILAVLPTYVHLVQHRATKFCMMTKLGRGSFCRFDHASNPMAMAPYSRFSETPLVLHTI